jgi:hypothetical protein
MTSVPACAGQSLRTFLLKNSERVFLCLSAAEKAYQLRSHVAQRLAVQLRVRLASSLVAAWPAEQRVLARWGWVGETSGLFEQPIRWVVGML